MWNRINSVLEKNNENNQASNSTNENASITLSAIPVEFFTVPPKDADKSQQEPSITASLSTTSQKEWRQTSRRYHLLDNFEFAKQRRKINTLFNVGNDKPYNSEDLRQLLSHSALGEWTKAEAIWSKDPALLTRAGTIYHPNRLYKEGAAPENVPLWKNPGRPKYTGTAWQIAMRNEEYEEAKNMEQMMTADECDRQFFELFPTGKIECDQEKTKKINEALDAVFDAISRDDVLKDLSFLIPPDLMSDEITTPHLDALYALLKPSSQQTGLIFDVNAFIYALNKFIHIWDDISSKKEWGLLTFISLHIIEYMASLLPTRYLRPWTQGMYSVARFKEPLRRDTSEIASIDFQTQLSYFPFRNDNRNLTNYPYIIGASGKQSLYWNSDILLADCTNYYKGLYDQVVQERQNYSTIKVNNRP